MTETVQSAPRHPLFHPLFAKVEYHYNILFPEMQALFEKKNTEKCFCYNSASKKLFGIQKMLDKCKGL